MFNLPKDPVGKTVNTPYFQGETGSSHRGPVPRGAGMQTPSPYTLVYTMTLRLAQPFHECGLEPGRQKCPVSGVITVLAETKIF